MDSGNNQEQFGATPFVLGFVMVCPVEHIHRVEQFSKDRFYLYKHFFDYPGDSCRIEFTAIYSPLIKP